MAFSKIFYAVLTVFKYSYYIGLSLMVASISFLGAAAMFIIFYLSGAYGELENHEFMVAFEFASWGLIMVLLGFALSRITPPPLSRGSAIAITVAVWLLVPLISSIPLSLTIDISIVDALFEAVAGWTTTGLTIMLGAPSSQGGYVPSIEELPETVKIWRSLIQWEGGVGIVVFTIAFLARPGISAAVLYLAEGRYERLEASLKSSAYKMTQVYMVFTFIGVVVLTLSGMNIYDSILHSMTAISTAGFSVYDESIGQFKGQYFIYISTLVVSFLGAMSFVDLDNIMSLRFRRLLKSPEFRAQIVLALLASILALIIWARSPVMWEDYTPADAVYNALSALSTVGYSTASLEHASDAYMVLLIILSFIGGSAFSTAGGIKILRLLIVLKAIDIEVRSLVMPKGYVPRRRLGEFKLDEAIIRRALAAIAAFMLSYAILVLIAFVLYSDRYDSVDLIFEVTSALANIGLSSGVTSPEAPLGLKLLLIMGMLLGRLEIIPYIVAFSYLTYALRR